MRVCPSGRLFNSDIIPDDLKTKAFPTRAGIVIAYKRRHKAEAEAKAIVEAKALKEAERKAEREARAIASAQQDAGSDYVASAPNSLAASDREEQPEASVKKPKKKCSKGGKDGRGPWRTPHTVLQNEEL